jgi:hypothetical protein
MASRKRTLDRRADTEDIRVALRRVEGQWEWRGPPNRKPRRERMRIDDRKPAVR